MLGACQSAAYAALLTTTKTVDSPQGLISAASTLTPNNRAATTHLRGPGPLPFRYIDGVQDLTALVAGGAAPKLPTACDATCVARADVGDFDSLLALPAAFLANFAAFLRAFLLGPVETGFSSCGRVSKSHQPKVAKTIEPSKHGNRERFVQHVFLVQSTLASSVVSHTMMLGDC